MYRHLSNQDLMTAALNGLINKLDLKGQTFGEVALGAVIKHSRDWNLARECVIESGLNIRTPAVDLQRACGTSIEAAIMIGNKIALGRSCSPIPTAACSWICMPHIAPWTVSKHSLVFARAS